MKKERRLLIALIFMLLSVTGAKAQQQKVTLNFKNTPVSQVFMAISKQTGLDFVYSNSQLQGFPAVTINAQGLTVKEALETILGGKNYTYKFEKNSIVIQRATYQPQQAQQTGHVVGTVTDGEGNPLPGVTITFRGSKFGTQTSADGTYFLNTRDIKKGELVFTYIGMKDHVVNYKGQTLVNVMMEEDENLLDDVVVTGYGTYKRGEYVGAVSQVRADDIKIAGEATIDQMLQGVIPGMSVVNTTGKVGGTPKIRIRGTSTILGNQEPLWVVDDVIQTNPNPIPNDASPLSSDMEQMMETAGNAISWLNPADIETITVLKDASATAIYGSQAANGVIVITTKKAKAGSGFSINYAGNISITQKPSYGLYDLMNSQEHMKYQQQMWEDRDAYTQYINGVGYGGILQQLHNKEITRQEFEQAFRKMENENTDWFDLLFRTPVSQQHNVSVSSAGEKVSSRFSVGFNNSLGEAKGNDMSSFTASSNTTFHLNKNLTIDLGVNGSYRKTKNFAFGVSPYNYAMTTSRTIPAYNEDGTYYYYPIYGSPSRSFSGKSYYNYNILNEIENTGTENSGTTFQTSLSVRWEFIKHLQAQLDGSMNMSNSKISSWATEYSEYIAAMRGYEYGEANPNSLEERSSILPFGGVLNSQNNNTVNYSFRGAFVYTNTFNKLHNVTFNVGMQATSNKVDGETFLRYGYMKYRGKTFANVPDASSLSSAVSTAKPTDLNLAMRDGTSIVDTRANQLSEYFTAVYNYDNRYVLNLNGRLDASNRFGQDENKKFNPSFSLGGKWRIGEEHFMEWARSWYDMFDISFSYGWRGNAVQSVSPYLIARDGGLNAYFGQYILNIVSLPYPGLGWEKTKDWNFGIDFSFFDGRLSAGFNTYGKKSDVLSAYVVPAEYGVSSAYIDGTIMRNKGYELIISATPVRTKDWTWSLSFNTSKVRNKVENNQLQNLPMAFLTGTALSNDEPYGTFYAFDFAGLDPENGRPTFNKIDREDTPVDFREYLVKAGSIEPDISGGINTSLRYKNFHLRATFAISLGAKAFLPTYYATSGATRPEDNVPRYMFDRWRQPGDELKTDIPSIPPGNPTVNNLWVDLPYGDDTAARMLLYNMYNYSTARVADTDFIRCRNLSLQYDLPKNLIRHIGMRSAYATLSLTNPFFIAFDSKWEGRDPETASWPARRSLSFSLNLSF